MSGVWCGFFVRKTGKVFFKHICIQMGIHYCVRSETKEGVVIRARAETAVVNRTCPTSQAADCDYCDNVHNSKGFRKDWFNKKMNFQKLFPEKNLSIETLLEQFDTRALEDYELEHRSLILIRIKTRWTSNEVSVDSAKTSKFECSDSSLDTKVDR